MPPVLSHSPFRLRVIAGVPLELRIHRHQIGRITDRNPYLEERFTLGGVAFDLLAERSEVAIIGETLEDGLSSSGEPGEKLTKTELEEAVLIDLGPRLVCIGICGEDDVCCSAKFCVAGVFLEIVTAPASLAASVVEPGPDMVF